MKTLGLILVLLMFANTLNGEIGNKVAKIQEERFVDKNIQRKLEEKTNYVTFKFNEESSFKIQKGDIISKISINGIDQNLNEEITLPKDTEVQVHYNTTLSAGNNLLSIFTYEIRHKIISIDLSKFDSSNLGTMDSMFSSCFSLESIDFSNFDFSKVSGMVEVFYGCSSLTSIDLSNFNTSKVTDMGFMFGFCSSLKSIDLSKFDTSQVIDMNEMFSSCSSLTSIDLSNFDTSKVTDMALMFIHCSSLTSINLTNFNTSNVEDMNRMFSHCSSLTSMNLSNFDTSKVEDMSGMFINCSSLISINLSNFDTSKVTNMDYMFQNCTSLKLIDISNFYITEEALYNRTFDIYFYPIFDIFFNDYNIEYINLYNTKDNGFISNSSINEIYNLIVCQKSNIITNPTAKNNCSEDDQEETYTINTRVFLSGYSKFNIVNSDMFSFFIYFFALKNTINSQTLSFPLSITYKNKLRILQDNAEANCTKVQPNNSELNKYNCSVLAQTSNIDNIDLSTDFNFKPKTTFESFYISSLGKMDLYNFPNITDKEYNSSEIFILDNSTINKYNNTHFEIKGIIEKSNPKFEEKAQILIEDNLSENDKFKKLNCSISNETSNNYTLMCLANENVEFNSQSLTSLSGDKMILINLESENENEKFIFNGTEKSNGFHVKRYYKKKGGSKSWIAVIVVVPIVAILAVIAAIVFFARKSNPSLIDQTSTQNNLNIA